MCLGIYMAISGNHVYGGAHAHINLIGFVLSLLYAFVLRLWVPDVPSRLVSTQCWAHQIGVVFFAVGLFLLLGGHAAPAIMIPVILIGALLVLSAAVMMLFIFSRTK
jgi:hypothetical protein